MLQRPDLQPRRISHGCTSLAQPCFAKSFMHLHLRTESFRHFSICCSIQHSPHAKPTRQRHLRDQHERDPRSGECQKSSAALLQRTVELHTRVRHVWAGLLPLCQPKCIFCRRCLAGADQLQHRGCCIGYSQKWLRPRPRVSLFMVVRTSCTALFDATQMSKPDEKIVSILIWSSTASFHHNMKKFSKPKPPQSTSSASIRSCMSSPMQQTGAERPHGPTSQVRHPPSEVLIRSLWGSKFTSSGITSDCTTRDTTEHLMLITAA